MPSKPVGPLAVSDVTESSAELSWQQPTLDGGSPITSYIVEYKQTNEKSWKKVLMGVFLLLKGSMINCPNIYTICK